MEFNTFEIIFSDPTLSKCKGVFVDVKKDMEKDLPNKNFPWTLLSTVTFKSIFGYSDLECSFNSDGKVLIEYYDYKSSGDNVSIRFLSNWCQDNGWKTPEVSFKLVIDKNSFAFWKEQLETHLVECPSLKEKISNTQE